MDKPQNKKEKKNFKSHMVTYIVQCCLSCHVLGEPEHFDQSKKQCVSLFVEVPIQSTWPIQSIESMKQQTSPIIVS